ncbi:acyltransferase family protein [Nocardioides nitrophenolicus]|uniref:acyltransferase family protein n=1 Tax=Nocardioides nitrophenolicus TaxID=60489 RepID=UPI00195E44C9|nr:acyltransferase family protein [Nocardioides nitrophenolicus]MBM7520172.1 fucose 4-O-acetylase-like acetyltransferase [Nocardioides nitrophenolicus]
MRQQWVDGVRGLAMLAVVVFHAELVAGPLGWLAAANQDLAHVRMPLLMVLSGLLLSRSLAKGPRRHLAGKARAVLWPYVVWASIDLLQVCVHLLATGEPLPRDLLRLAVYNPSGYLWFLGFLFCYHLLATPLAPWLRGVAGPALVVLGGTVEATDPHRFVTLAGWFLVGDLLGRVVGPRVPAGLRALVGRVRWGPLAAIGRQSVVYYACHLIVMVYAVRLVHRLGMSEPRLVVPVAVVVPLGVGALLVWLRRHRWVDALFVWPRVDSTAGAEQSGADAHRDQEGRECLATPSGRPRSTRRPRSTPSAASSSPS